MEHNISLFSSLINVFCGALCVISLIIANTRFKIDISILTIFYFSVVYLINSLFPMNQIQAAIFLRPFVSALLLIPLIFVVTYIRHKIKEENDREK